MIQSQFRGADVDAFGRQRVSQVTSLLDVKHQNDKTPDEIVLCATPLSNNSDIIASIDWLKSL